MTHAYRTFARRLGYAGLVGCCLVGAPALAAGGTWIKNTSGTIDGGSYVKVVSSAKWTSPDGALTKYTDVSKNIAKSTLRVGALSALSRGVMHPGFQLAVAAAGFAWSLKDGIYSPEQIIDVTSNLDPSLNYRCYHTGWYYSPNNPGSVPWYSSPTAGNTIDCNSPSFVGSSSTVSYEQNGSSHYTFQCNSNNDCKWNRISPYTSGTPASEMPAIGYNSPESEYTGDYSDIDPHIPPSIVGELWSDDPIPEWDQEISSNGAPGSSVQSDGQVAPGVADAVGKWGENMDAQYNGDETLPNPDEPVGGDSATDRLYDELDLDGPVPPFGDPEVQWQTEELDLPAYSSGIGSGSCPASQAIALPLGAGPLTISYQPACDLATMVRPALVGVCGLIALMIVLRARGGA